MPVHAWVVVAAVLLLSCGDPAPSTVTVPATSTTEPADAPGSTTPAPGSTAGGVDEVDEVEAAVERAFHEQWDAFVTILENPDPEHPLIDRHFTGRARKRVLEAVEKFLAEGLRARRPNDPGLFMPRIVSLDITGPDSAVVIECTTDGIQQVDTATGTIVNDRITQAHVLNHFRREAGVWRVASTSVLGRGDPCVD